MATDPVAQAVNSMVEGWLAEFFVKPRLETASQLCSDFKQGLISGREALAGLRQLGYSARSAQNILSICYLKNIPKTMKVMPKPGTPDYQKMQDALNS